MTDSTNVEPRSIIDRWADDEANDGFVMIRPPVAARRTADDEPAPDDTEQTER